MIKLETYKIYIYEYHKEHEDIVNIYIMKSSCDKYINNYIKDLLE